MDNWSASLRFTESADAEPRVALRAGAATFDDAAAVGVHVASVELEQLTSPDGLTLDWTTPTTFDARLLEQRYSGNPMHARVEILEGEFREESASQLAEGSRQQELRITLDGEAVSDETHHRFSGVMEGTLTMACERYETAGGGTSHVERVGVDDPWCAGLAGL
ncbi:MAG: hypothetical protein R3F61_12930 [Myxococcota bacterium]